MKRNLSLVLAILVMAATAAWSASSTLSADGTWGHISRGCLLCHTPHANGQLAYNPAATTKAIPSGAYVGATAPAAGSWAASAVGDSRGVNVYLWLNPLTPTTYTTWDGGTLANNGSETARDPEVHSLLCLSCHDGSTTGNSYDMGGTLASAGATAPSGASLPAYNPGSYSGSAVTQYINANSAWSTSGSLQSTHPVHARYPISGSTDSGDTYTYWKVTVNPDRTVTFNDSSFDLGFAGSTGEAMGHPARLYSDGTNAYVECTSCHEPHRMSNYAYQTQGGTGSWNIGGAASTLYYIRGPYTGSFSHGTSTLTTSVDSGLVNANFCRSCHYDKSSAYDGTNQ
jgi:hypothetical protein